MSLVIAHLAADRALLAVDTFAGSTAGWAAVGEKMLPLPAHHCILAMRGVTQALPALAFELACALVRDFDEILEFLPAALRGGRNVLRVAAEARGLELTTADALGYELAAVGWSPKRSTMVGVTYRFDAVSQAFAEIPIDRWRVHGAEEEWLPFPADAPDTAERMQAFAEWVVRNSRARRPDLALGGRLLLAELTRDSMTIKTQCDLGLPTPA